MEKFPASMNLLMLVSESSVTLGTMSKVSADSQRSYSMVAVSVAFLPRGHFNSFVGGASCQREAVAVSSHV